MIAYFQNMMCGMSLPTTREKWLTPKLAHTHSYGAVDLVLGCVDWCLTHICQTHAVFHCSALQLAPVQQCLKTLIFKTTVNTHTRTHIHTHSRLRDTAFANVLFPVVTVFFFSDVVCLLKILCPNIYFRFSLNVITWSFVSKCVYFNFCLIFFNFLAQLIHFGQNAPKLLKNCFCFVFCHILPYASQAYR